MAQHYSNPSRAEQHRYSEEDLEIVRFAIAHHFKGTSTDLELLALDCASIIDDEPEFLEAAALDVVTEWRNRLGGWGNVYSYLKCLQVPNRR